MKTFTHRLFRIQAVTGRLGSIRGPLLGKQCLYCAVLCRSRFLRDHNYDLLHVWKETPGTYLAERWLQGNGSDLNTEVVRFSADGSQTSVLVSANPSVLPALPATEHSGLVDPTGTTFAFSYRSLADGNYYIAVIRNGAMQKIAMFSSSNIGNLMVRAVGGDWVLFATGPGTRPKLDGAQHGQHYRWSDRHRGCIRCRCAEYDGQQRRSSGSRHRKRRRGGFHPAGRDRSRLQGGCRGRCPRYHHRS